MRIFTLLTILVLTVGFAINSRKPTKTYPQDYFRSPIDQTIRLSGTFGELRPNHLHSGIDIKATGGKNGQPIYAIADGYIARIKVQSGGYGNALYLVHPNGYMSVYAHLQNFERKVANYVEKTQYEKQSFNVDLYLNGETFRVKKGEKIGNLGTSGRSFGPHLHFEIRDNKTQKPINPLLFGLKMEDDMRPKLHNVKIYHLNDKLETIDTKIHSLVKKGGGKYGVKGDTLAIGAWRAGFGIKVYDHHNGVTNWNGIYALEIYQDEQLIHAFDMETFSFGESRYINAHIDYAEQKLNKAYYNRSYKLPGNRLSIYEKNEGVVTLHIDEPSKIKVVALDVDGNKAVLDFWVKRKKVIPSDSGNYNYSMLYGKTNTINTGLVKAVFSKGTFYENAYLNYQQTADESDDIYSDMHHLHNESIPVHKYFNLSIQGDRIPEHLRSKAFIAHCDSKQKMASNGGKWKDGYLTAKVRSLGDYCIMIDDTKPIIQPISFRHNMTSRSRMTFKITDNMPTTGKARGLSFNATIDGKWILMRYDEKNDLLIHQLDERTLKGEHTLKITLKDDRGNKNVYQRQFIR
ncbi:MAG: M23 family metallopeptidase [Saprospiraceae bacterium]